MVCCLTLLAPVRLAGFRLMEAGLEPKPTIEGSFLRSLKFCAPFHPLQLQPCYMCSR